MDGPAAVEHVLVLATIKRPLPGKFRRRWIQPTRDFCRATPAPVLLPVDQNTRRARLRAFREGVIHFYLSPPQDRNGKLLLRRLFHICIFICVICGGSRGVTENLSPRARANTRKSSALHNSTIFVRRAKAGSNCGTILFFGSANQDVDIINVAGVGKLIVVVGGS